MDKAQFDAATAGTNEQRDVAARQVSGGFILAGVRRFLNPDTGAVVLQQSFETVAADAAEAGNKVADFLDTGKF